MERKFRTQATERAKETHAAHSKGTFGDEDSRDEPESNPQATCTLYVEATMSQRAPASDRIRAEQE